MTAVTITHDQLVVTPQGLHKLWAFKRMLSVPLTSVRGATVDPGMAHEPKGRRAPGLHVPGAAVIGTFHHEGDKQFWDIGSGARAIVIELRDAEYSQLVVEVDDPRRTVEMINQAAAQAGQER